MSFRFPTGMGILRSRARKFRQLHENSVGRGFYRERDTLENALCRVLQSNARVVENGKITVKTAIAKTALAFNSMTVPRCVLRSRIQWHWF